MSNSILLKFIHLYSIIWLYDVDSQDKKMKIYERSKTRFNICITKDTLQARFNTAL